MSRFEASNGVTQRVFQTWKSRTSLPENFATWARSFRDLNPGYEYVLCDDADNRAFIATQFGWFLAVYDSYPQEIMRADAVRYFQLFAHGGFYADLDTECLRSLDDLLDAGDVVLARMGNDPSHPHSIPNAMMASRPRQEFWLLVFWLLVRGSKEGRPEWRTGPVLLKSAVDLWNAADQVLLPSVIREVKSWLSPEYRNTVPTRRLTILPPRRWYGLDWTDPVHQLVRHQVLGGAMLDASVKAALFPDADMVTYWAHSWEAWPPRPGS